MIFLNVRTRFCCHIDPLTHREAVTGYPAGHRLASFLALPSFEALAHQYSWRDMYVCDELASSLKDMLTSAVLSSCLLIFPFP